MQLVNARYMHCTLASLIPTVMPTDGNSVVTNKNAIMKSLESGIDSLTNPGKLIRVGDKHHNGGSDNTKTRKVVHALDGTARDGAISFGLIEGSAISFVKDVSGNMTIRLLLNIVASGNDGISAKVLV